MVDACPSAVEGLPPPDKTTHRGITVDRTKLINLRKAFKMNRRRDASVKFP